MAGERRFADVERLQQRIRAETPQSGDYLYDYRLKEAEAQGDLLSKLRFDKTAKTKFADLPISKATLLGLQKQNFNLLTEVQRCVIPHALAGRDIVTAAKTGSGKTLAYLVPLVEVLYREKYTPDDGLGALVLVPTRELAMQVFEVFNSFTEKQKTISVGLVIGGKSMEHEQLNIQRMNVVIATPGRFLHHLESTYGLEPGNLKVLVLDEADMMFEMGFEESIRQILEALPAQRQTLLLSATLTKKVLQLAHISLNQPENILLNGKGVASGEFEFPEGLKQFYMIVPLAQKVDTLFSFIKTHTKAKVLVFLSTCKQVRFCYEALKKFRLGCPLFELQGRQKQNKRMALFYTFKEKRHAVLITTNIAARGLDFPVVDWVLQVDAPEDIETYIHRVGRTARYNTQGRSLLFVCPQELPFVNKLKDKKVLINKITQNPQKLHSITNSLQAYCSEEVELKYLAQRAFISYVRFVHKAPDKTVFNLRRLNLSEFARSLGLVQQPVVQIMERDEEQEEQAQQRKLQKLRELRKAAKERKMQMKQDKQHQQLKERRNETILSSKYQELRADEQADGEEEEDFLRFKQSYQGKGELDPARIKVSKNQLRKVHENGVLGGLNREVILDDGRIVKEEQFEKMSKRPREEPEPEALQYSRKLEEHREEDALNELARRKIKRKKRKELTARQDDQPGVELDQQ